MADTMTETFNANSKRMYKKENDINSDLTSIGSNKNSVTSSMMNSNDWHRILLSRLKPGIIRKHRTTRKLDNQLIIPPPTPVEESSVTYNDDSLIIDRYQTTINQADISSQLDSSVENSMMKKDSRFVKHSPSNRSDDHITSLKRRVRKQQLRHLQTQTTTLQETTYQLPTSKNIIVMSYPEQGVSPRRYKSKKSSRIVSLPSLINTNRAAPTQLHDIKLNIYGY